MWVWLVSQREIRNRLAGSPWERFLTHQVALYSPLSKVCSRPLMFFFIALSIFRPCVRARAKKRAADERAASAIWVERSSSTKSFLSSPGGGAPPHAHDRRGPQAARAARRRPKAARRRPPRRRGGARLPHSTARRIVGIAHSGGCVSGGYAAARVRRRVEDSCAPCCHCEAPTLSHPVPARGPRGLPVAGVARPQSRARMRPREASTRGSTRRVDRPRPRGRRHPGARAWVGAARQVRRGTAARAMGLRGRG